MEISVSGASSAVRAVRNGGRTRAFIIVKYYCSIWAGLFVLPGAKQFLVFSYPQMDSSEFGNIKNYFIFGFSLAARWPIINGFNNSLTVMTIVRWVPMGRATSTEEMLPLMFVLKHACTVEESE